MKIKITKEQRKFCKYYYKLQKEGKPRPELAAILAGYPEEAAEEAGQDLLQKEEIRQYLAWLKQCDVYTLKDYYNDINLLQKNLTCEITPDDAGYIINPALFLKAIQMKAKLFNLDTVEISEIEEPAETTELKAKKGRAYSMRYSNKNNDNERIDLFNKIEERSHVFEKIRHTNA
jgi:phage terminase small subunit